MRMKMLRISTLFILAVFSFSCCLKRDKTYRFPDEAVQFYDNHDTIVFMDNISGEFDSLIVCSRETGQSIEDWGGSYCDYKEIYIERKYILTKDSCQQDTSTFIVNVRAQGTISITWDLPDGSRGVYSMYAPYDETPKLEIDIQGKTYTDVVRITNSQILGSWILINYSYGILQYTRNDTITKLLYNEN